MSNQTLTLDQLAQIASEHSGLPFAFTKSLIQEEGTWNQGSGNPFDVTAEWANLTGFGSWVTGLWNSIGVAIFSDPGQAIQAWAKGLATFSNYSQFRADQANGASPYQLALDLQKSGYAGSDSGYAGKIASLYEQNSGQSAYAPLGKSATTPGAATLGGGTANPTSNPGKTSPPIVAGITGAVTAPLQAVGSALATPFGALNATANAIADVGSIAAKAISVVESALWTALGLILALAGLYLLVKDQG